VQYRASARLAHTNRGTDKLARTLNDPNDMNDPNDPNDSNDPNGSNDPNDPNDL
jgi:hypothetical protein